MFTLLWCFFSGKQVVHDVVFGDLDSIRLTERKRRFLVAISASVETVIEALVAMLLLGFITLP